MQYHFLPTKVNYNSSLPFLVSRERFSKLKVREIKELCQHKLNNTICTFHVNCEIANHTLTEHPETLLVNDVIIHCYGSDYVTVTEYIHGLFVSTV